MADMQQYAEAVTGLKKQQWAPHADALPLKNFSWEDVYLGTVYASSEWGSQITFYSYVDPARECSSMPFYKSIKRQMHVASINFERLHRMDRIHFYRWEDFEILDSPKVYWELLQYLEKNEFCLTKFS